ncbi:MAG: hypothetical protein AMXMBFR46_20890 [Acidimicrobiia bacterium]
MSGLWTPSGEHVPDPAGGAGGGAGGDAGGAGPGPGAPDDAAVEAELRRVRAEIAGTPAVDIVANHAIGLWQLAVLHLSPEAGAPLRLSEAAVAIDAMAGIVDALGDRLGDHAAPLRDAVSQLRLAFVEIQREASGTGGPPAPAG